MASTRQKNSQGDYVLEQKSIERLSAHTLYPYRRVSYKTALPDAGINVGHVPANQLSSNAVDIESRLYGINANNLIKPQEAIVPGLNLLPNASFFERITTFMPEPLVMEKGQRPHPSN
tara:strand:- start:811 stop:1164 length:354 start_codon:yes stop_codon:yes gene_type:complete